MTLIIASLTVVWIMGLSAIAIALRNAPEAYEDEEGFHFLEPIWCNNSPQARDVACVWTDSRGSHGFATAGA